MTRDEIKIKIIDAKINGHYSFDRDSIYKQGGLTYEPRRIN